MKDGKAARKFATTALVDCIQAAINPGPPTFSGVQIICQLLNT